MAPQENLSPPGSSSYSSNTMNVGDGTWDYERNSFLLPNLMGLNFETMRYNGMGNRFSTLTQYHSLILGHGVLAAITFLFLVPVAVLVARFYTKRPGYAVRYHAYLQVLAVGFTTIVFILGFIAVGPPRNLTNPHHGIGVAIYVLILLQAFGGRLVRNISGRSFRLHLHRWSGRAIALLGIVQVPLGLTLYGSPKYLFILYAVWMGFLVFLFFVFDYKDSSGRGGEYYAGGRSESGRYTAGTSEYKSSAPGGGNKMKWLGGLAAGAGALALLRGRKKNQDVERGPGSRSPSPSHRSRDLPPEVISSPGGGPESSYFDEKRTERRVSGGDGGGGGGFFKKMFGLGAAAGAGGLMGRMMSRRNDRGRDDETEYSAIATDTPSRVHRPRRAPPSESDYTTMTPNVHRHGSRRYDDESTVLTGDPVRAAAAMSAAEERRRPGARPMTPQRSHAGHSRFESVVDSDYSSYVSPSRRPSAKKRNVGGGAGKGILAGLGLGWFAKKTKDRRDAREEERLRDEEDRRRDEEEDRRAGHRGPRYTGDGYGTPTRRESRRRPTRPRPPPSGYTATTASGLTEDSSIEPRGDTPYDPAPVGAGAPRPPQPPVSGPPPPGGGPSVIMVPPGNTGPPAGSSRHDGLGDPATMPPMPPDPHYQDSGSEGYFSAGGAHRRQPSRRRDADAAAAAAVASASALAQEEADRRARRAGGGSAVRPGSRDQTPPGYSVTSGQPSASVRLHVRDDRNVTLRRMTEEEARRERRRGRADSVSSHSEADTPSSRRYRREMERERERGRSSSQRSRAEAAAEQRVESELAAPPPPPPPIDTGSGLLPPLNVQPAPTAPSSQGAPPPPWEPLEPPNPAFAQGRARPAGKDSAYYSGAAGGGIAGPSGATDAGMSMSSLGDSPGGYNSALSPTPSGRDMQAAADRRRRRRLERREGSNAASTRTGMPSGTVEFE